MAQVASQTCDICSEFPGFYYCLECGQLFCKGCKMCHLNTNMSKNHSFVMASSIKQKPKVDCVKHNENYKYICEFCDTSVCFMCMTESHSGHKMIQVNEKVRALKAELEYQLQSKVTYLQSGVSKIETTTDWLIQNTESTIMEIQQKGQKVKDEVDMEVENMIRTVRDLSRKEIQKLASVDEDLKTSLNKMKGLEISYKEISHAGEGFLALEILKQLLEDTNNIITYQKLKYPGVKFSQFNVAKDKLDTSQVVGTLSKKHYSSHLNLVLLGSQGSGKSSTGNSIVGVRAFKVSSGSKTLTTGIDQALAFRDEYVITVFDTPSLKRAHHIEDLMQTLSILNYDQMKGFVYLVTIKIGIVTENEIELLNTLERYGICFIVVFTNEDELTDVENERQQSIESWLKMNNLLFRTIGRFDIKYVALKNKNCSKEEKGLQVEGLINAALRVLKEGKKRTSPRRRLMFGYRHFYTGINRFRFNRYDNSDGSESE